MKVSLSHSLSVGVDNLPLSLWILIYLIVTAPVPRMLLFFLCQQSQFQNPSGIKIHSYRDRKDICALSKQFRLDNIRSGCQISNTWLRIIIIIIIMKEHIAHCLWSNQNSPQPLSLCSVASARAEMVRSGRGWSRPLRWSTAGLGSLACPDSPRPKMESTTEGSF